MEHKQPKSYQKWRDSQKKLDDAIQHYLRCATELESGVSRPTHGLSDSQSLKKIVLKAYDDIESTSFRVDRLEQMQRVLIAIRNAPSPLVPINTLPSDILHQIFSLMVGQPQYHTHDLDPPHMWDLSDSAHKTVPSLKTLSHVCARWRTIVINTPTFWSHVHVKFNNQGELKSRDCLETCLGRASSAPMCLCIDGRGSIPKKGFKMLQKVLGANVHNLGVLCSEGYLKGNRSQPRGYCRDLSVVSFWLNNGRPGTVHTLVLNLYSRTVKIDPKALAPNQQQLDLFLEPIRVLHLRRAYFDWDSPVYHNLTVLELVRMGYKFTAADLMKTLSNCSNLHTLRLYHLHLGDPPETSFEPIIMPALKRLDMNIYQRRLGRLMPNISLGSQQLTVQLTVAKHHTCRDCNSSDDDLRAFFARSDVKTLCVQRLDTGTLSMYLAAVPLLNTLIVLDAMPGLSLSAALARSSHSGSERVPFCPELHTLYLVDGKFDVPGVQAILQINPSIKKLRFLSCKFEPSEEEVLASLKPCVDIIRSESYINHPYLRSWFTDLS